MDVFERDRVAARLISGHETLTVQYDGGLRPFGLRPPTPADRLRAAEAAYAARNEALIQGVPTEDETLRLLERLGLWSDKDRHDLEVATKAVDKLKVGIYLAKTSRERDEARKALRKTRALIRTLSARKSEGRDKSAEGLAEAARIRSLVASCLDRPDGTPAFPGGFAHDTSLLLDAACQAYATTRAGEAEIREVARTEPWRSVWASREACPAVFAAPASLLTDEQRLLVQWTRMYDNAAQDENAPGDEVVADDDWFDGWMIHRRQSRDKEAAKGRLNQLIGNEKIAGAQEVLVVGAAPGEVFSGLTPEEISTVESMNTPEAARLKAQRAALLAKKGAMHELEFPDVQQRLHMEFNQGMAARGRG